jgi:hypothetical protein
MNEYSELHGKKEKVVYQQKYSQQHSQQHRLGEKSLSDNYPDRSAVTGIRAFNKNACCMIEYAEETTRLPRKQNLEKQLHLIRRKIEKWIEDERLS